MENKIESHKFRHHLTKNLIGTFFATTLFLSAVSSGIWDIVEGDVFIDDGNGIFGIFVVILGIILPFLISIFILKWDKDQNLDFTIFLLTLIVNVILIGLYIFLPIILFTLILKPWLSSIILFIGITLLLVSIIQSKRKKWSFGIFCLTVGNNLIFTSLYCIIGGIITA